VLIFTDLLVIAMKLQSTENLCRITMLLFLHYTSPSPPPKKLQMFWKCIIMHLIRNL